MRYVIAAIAVFLAACDAFTPNVDPEPFPCHNPQMHYCVPHDGYNWCCYTWQACVANGKCEDQGNTWAHRLDGGADGD